MSAPEAASKLTFGIAVVRPENGASQRVLAKIGLRFEKFARYYNLDLKYYALDRPAYQPAGTPYTLYPAHEEP